MRVTLAWMLTLALSLLSLRAFACGGGFGQQVTINPSQKIVLRYVNGEETYVFQPHFCGEAADFGLILPIPNALTANPTLGDTSLVTDLEIISAPRVETVEVCASGGFLGSSSKSSNGSAPSQTSRSSDGVDVISQGQVGQFQWQLLRATTARDFTDWLDANQFPYPSTASAAFDHYVQAGWYFVAFSVAASPTAPPAGYRLCGDFGPITLSFPTSRAVVPARIAAAGDQQSTFDWRLMTISEHVLAASKASDSAAVTQTPRYAGALTASNLTTLPDQAVAKFASAGQWFTELELSFYAGSLTQDIWLEPATTDTPYQRTVYVEKEVDCGVFGCSVRHDSSNSSGRLATVLGLMSFAIGVAVRRRPRVR